VLVIFLLFPVLGIIAALALAISEGTLTPAAFSTPLPVTDAPYQIISLLDKPAPDFVLDSLDGESHRLSDYQGQIVFVNFWATWCPPCREELPAFMAFSEDPASKGAVILAVNTAETPEQIRQYFSENGITGLTVLLDSQLEAYTAYDIQVMPTTFVIDQTGVIRQRHFGALTLDDLYDYVDRLTTP
jgi:thiol-disulfide isomerase/thioredoxin